jgi:hypothetical protein
VCVHIMDTESAYGTQTCNRLEVGEMARFERVVHKAGSIIHCPGTADMDAQAAQHDRLLYWGYAFSRYKEADGWKRKYWKRR